MGTATTQGELWGRNTSDWAELQEPHELPWFRATLNAAGLAPGLRLLDAGCGSGLALGEASGRGAEVAGLDASEELLAVAARRVPGADLRQGDLEELPFETDEFDIVTAFNSLQYAADPRRALGELVRVARPGGRVAIGIWGDPERCEMEPIFDELGRLAPPDAKSTAAVPLALSEEGVLESLLDEAGASLVAGGESNVDFVYRDLDEGWRAQASAGPFARAIDVAGEPAVRDAYLKVFEPLVQEDGSVRSRNVFRYVVSSVQ